MVLGHSHLLAKYIADNEIFRVQSLEDHTYNKQADLWKTGKETRCIYSYKMRKKQKTKQESFVVIQSQVFIFSFFFSFLPAPHIIFHPLIFPSILLVFPHDEYNNT